MVPISWNAFHTFASQVEAKQLVHLPLRVACSKFLDPRQAVQFSRRFGALSRNPNGSNFGIPNQVSLPCSQLDRV